MTAEFKVPRFAPLSQRVWSNVSTWDGQKCWEWIRRKDRNGYGLIKLNGRPRFAHRVAYSVRYGSIPSGMFVCHSCDNSPCCNPAHLFLGTSQDNMTDAASKGRLKHCPPKFTSDQIIEIRRLRNSGAPHKALSEKFNVSFRTIVSICSRKTWKNL